MIMGKILIILAFFLLVDGYVSSTSVMDSVVRDKHSCAKTGMSSCGLMRPSLVPLPYQMLVFLRKQVPEIMPQRGSMAGFSATWLLDKNFSDLKSDEFHYVPQGPKGPSSPLLDPSNIVSPSPRKGQNYIVARSMDNRHPPEWIIHKHVMLNSALRSYEKTKAVISYSYFNPTIESARRICNIQSVLKVKVLMAFSIAKKDTDKAKKVLMRCGIRMLQVPPTVPMTLTMKEKLDDLLPMPNVDYIIHGYNILFGNPIVDPIEGHDPGFTGIPVFEANYEAKQTTADNRWLVPDGMFFLNAVGCRIEFQSVETRSEKSYTDSMANTIDASTGFFGFEFKSSTTFQKKTEELRTGTFSYVNTQAVCSSYTGSVFLDDPPSLSSQFITSIKKCAGDPSDKNFKSLVENYGTHFIVGVVMGSKFGEESKIETSSYEKLVAEGVDVGVSAGYSGMFAAGVGTETDKQKEDREKFEGARASKTMYSYGSSIPADGSGITWASTSTETPMPINIDLTSIAELLTDDFKDDLGDIDYKTLREKLVDFLTRYCSLLKDEGKAKDCMPPTEFTTDGPGMTDWLTAGKDITGIDMIDDKTMALVSGSVDDPWNLKILIDKKEVSSTFLQDHNYVLDLVVCPDRRRLGVISSDFYSWGRIDMFDASDDGKTVTKGLSIELQDHGVGSEDLIFQGLSYYPEITGFLLLKKAWSGTMELLKFKDICYADVQSVTPEVFATLSCDNCNPQSAVHLGDNVFAISLLLPYQVRRIQVVDIANNNNITQEIDASGTFYFSDMFKDNKKEIVVSTLAHSNGYGDGKIVAYRWLKEEKRLEFAADLLTEKSLRDMPSQGVVSVFSNTAYFNEGKSQAAKEYEFSYD